MRVQKIEEMEMTRTKSGKDIRCKIIKWKQYEESQKPEDSNNLSQSKTQRNLTGKVVGTQGRET